MKHKTLCSGPSGTGAVTADLICIQETEQITCCKLEETVNNGTKAKECFSNDSLHYGKVDRSLFACAGLY